MDRNLAPKGLEGDYKLTVDGNKVIVTSMKDHQTAMARCHPDDYFDIGEGINEAFEKLNGIHVGDKVEILDNGDCYNTYSEWVYNNVHGAEKCQYAYGDYPTNGQNGIVRAINAHSNRCSSVTLYYVQIPASDIDDIYDGKCYLVNERGIKKVNE